MPLEFNGDAAIVDNNATTADLNRLKKVAFYGVGGFFIFYAVLLLCSCKVAHAQSLTTFFTTQAFSGTYEVVQSSQFCQFIGMIMNKAFSILGFLGLVLIAWQRIVTLLYLSSRQTFDKVHELKTSHMTGGMLGLPKLFADTFGKSGGNGSGLDAFVNFFLALLPDVKEYSDYGEANKNKGGMRLEETDTITQYILKVSLSTIMLIFFLSLCWSGSMFQCYGKVVDAMTVVADNFIDLKLDSYVDTLINRGSAYQFSYEDDGTNIGKLEQNIAEDTYSKVVRQLANPSNDANQKVGKAIDDYFTTGEGGYFVKSSEIGDDGFAKANDKLVQVVNNGTSDASNSLWDGTDLKCKNVKYDVTINSTDKAYGDNDICIPVTSIAAGQSLATSYQDGGYIHIVFSKKANSNEDYFVPGGSTQSQKSSGHGSDGDTAAEQVQQ